MRKWIWRGGAAVIVLALAVGAAGFSYVTRDLNYGPPADRSAWENAPPTLQSANLAYIQRDVEGAREIWRAVAEAGDAPADDLATAYRRLSRTSWRIYQNTDEAIAFAQYAEAIDPGTWENAVALSAAYREAGNIDHAMADAARAAALADEPNARAQAAAALARAALAGTEAKRLDQLTVEDRARLAQARAAMAPLLANPPAPLEVSALGMKVGTRLDDGAMMWGAWRSYYHSPNGVSAMADRHEAAAVLSTALPGWTGTGAIEDRRAIALALADSFFFEEAALLVTDQRSPDAAALAEETDIGAALAMNAFVRSISRHTDEYYRAIAEAGTSSSLFAALQTFQYRRGRKQIAQELWAALGHAGPLDEEALNTEAEARFGIYYNEGPTSGVYDLHAGFRVLDAVHTESQYGRTAELRYVVIGRTISNGYESWLWDGRQQHGGWASNDTIYQVRSAYADDAIRRWNQLTDPVERREEEENIERLTAGDADALGTTRVAHLPGLAARLRWQGMNAVLDYARETGGEAGARGVFVREMGDAIRDYSIFAHEGRHALDKLYAEEWVRDNSPELEFRAKISQVVFSDWPRLAIGSILNPNLGDDTPHGIANARVMEGVVAWMEDHRTEIDGLDPGAPLLPQFDLLSDDQIRAAFRWQDPWAAQSETDEAS